MLIIEHRYYGYSQPFGNWDLENLWYHTTENALADIAFFLSSINDDLVFRYGGKKRKIFVMGGSYPGAMAAWMRYKYPHIVDGALASSAVVNAVDDMWAYDTVAWEAMSKSGKFCVDEIEWLVKYNDDLFKSDPVKY